MPEFCCFFRSHYKILPFASLRRAIDLTRLLRYLKERINPYQCQNLQPENQTPNQKRAVYWFASINLA